MIDRIQVIRRFKSRSNLVLSQIYAKGCAIWALSDNVYVAMPADLLSICFGL
jgi:hypothetical protein